MQLTGKNYNNKNALYRTLKIRPFRRNEWKNLLEITGYLIKTIVLREPSLFLRPYKTRRTVANIGQDHRNIQWNMRSTFRLYVLILSGELMGSA